ncbi:MAG: sulfatase-like hydrolase/transferase [Planctomycetaceae bacterium]
MKRLALLLAALLLIVKSASAQEHPPNVILCVADDLGYGDLRCCGATDMQTPNIDRLMSEGMQFTEFYANCPVCSPTRASLMTGRYPGMVGVPGVIRTHANNNWGHLTKDSVLLPLLLKQKDYHSFCVGKWHLGLDAPNTPLDRGFDGFMGFLGDMMDDYYTHLRHGNNYMRCGPVTFEPEGHATDLFTKWAIRAVESRKGKQEPFFLYLAYNAPHTPIQPPEDWLAKVKERDPNMTDRRAKLVALIEHLDHGFGQVLKAVDDSGLRDNTIVIFTSDNGGQLDVGANNGPLRDGKQSVYEGGIKVPCCVRWPGHVEAGSKTQFRAMSMDIYATIAATAGVAPPEVIEGRSFLPTILGKEQDELREHWFFHRREGGTRYGGKTIEAVRWGDWKLLQNDPFGPQELYNLKDDPLEANNLIEKRKDIFQKLAAMQREELQRYGSVPWQSQKASNGE